MPAPSDALVLLKRFVPRPIKGALAAVHQRSRLDRALRAVASLAPGRLPSRMLMDDLQEGWANDGMAARTDYLEEVCRQAARTSGPILECGSGLSTLLLGLMAGRRGVDTWTLEHLPEWRSRVAQVLARHRIPHVHLLLTPLRRYDGFDWYDVTSAPASEAFQLVVCDGPPSDTPGGRYGMLPLFRSRLAPGAIVLLDDADRPGEIDVLRKWDVEDGWRAVLRETPSGAFAIAARG